MFYEEVNIYFCFRNIFLYILGVFYSFGDSGAREISFGCGVDNGEGSGGGDNKGTDGTGFIHPDSIEVIKIFRKE